MVLITPQFALIIGIENGTKTINFIEIQSIRQMGTYFIHFFLVEVKGPR